MTLDKAVTDVLADKNTVVVIPEIGKEYDYALKWLRRNASKVISEQRVLTELLISSLQTDITIMTLARDFSNPIEEGQLDVTNKITYHDRAEADLLEEMRLSTPIKVSKYWVRDNPMRPGKPDVPGILEALGKECTPWRYIFVDKGETKPDILKLSKV